MKRWLGILLLAFVVTCSWVMANDYVDDVYVWVPKDKALSVSSSPLKDADRYAAIYDNNTPLSERKSAPTIEFLDDSITRQNPDTVVRAIIRR